jgi:hypothetical protein
MGVSISALVKDLRALFMIKMRELFRFPLKKGMLGLQFLKIQQLH